MSIFLSHTTALQIWRRLGDRLPLADARVFEDEASAASLAGASAESLAARASVLRDLPAPLHVVVPNTSMRRKSSLFACHVQDGLQVPPLFCGLGPGIYVSAPELCMLQLSWGADLVRLIELGFELCGTYSPGSSGTGELFHHAPLCGHAQLGALAGSVKGRRSTCEKFGRAVRYVLEGSDSPMETIQAMLVTLPRHMGGYGLGGALLNPKLPVPADLQRAAGRSFLRPDMYWQDCRVVLEYDSKRWHDGGDRRGSDLSRVSVLELMGLSVVSNTSHQLFSEERMDAVASHLAKEMGKRLRCRIKDHARLKRLLRACLLDSSGRL